LTLKENQLTDRRRANRVQTPESVPSEHHPILAKPPIRAAHLACEHRNQEVAMTTKVTVKAADWPVEVTITDHACAGEAVNTARVEPNGEHEFHLHSTRSIGLVELPKPEVAAVPVAEITEPAGDAA
jgi:hypothetical protein